MALIGMAVYSTEENKKDDCLQKTLSSLQATVDFTRHRLMVSVNAFTDQTLRIITAFANKGVISGIIQNGENLGTAEAINKIWKNRLPGEHAIKMDDDVVIHENGWVDLMEESIRRDPKIGIIGLKRKDLIQTPWHPDENFRSKLKLLPHSAGERWITVEESSDIMGTCTMYNSFLLDKIGYLFQIEKYGYDDNIACHRSHIAGHYNCFLNHIDIDHIDPGDTPYQDWKHKHSGECTQRYISLIHDMVSGVKPIYYNPFN